MPAVVFCVDVPRSQLVPPGWNVDEGFASFRYSHPSQRGKSYVIKAVSLGGDDGEETLEVHATVVKQSDIPSVAVYVPTPNVCWLCLVKRLCVCVAFHMSPTQECERHCAIIS